MAAIKHRRRILEHTCKRPKATSRTSSAHHCGWEGPQLAGHLDAGLIAAIEHLARFLKHTCREAFQTDGKDLDARCFTLQPAVQMSHNRMTSLCRAQECPLTDTLILCFRCKEGGLLPGKIITCRPGRSLMRHSRCRQQLLHWRRPLRHTRLPWRRLPSNGGNRTL